VARSLSLNFGVKAQVIERNRDPNIILMKMVENLKRNGYVESGDSLVVVSDLAVGLETLHAIHVHTIQ
jgi:pyruvate kinase